MGFEYGTGRGYVDKDKNMKIHCGNEAVWVRLLAVHENNKYGIGIMMNSMFSGQYKWGTLVKIEDSDPSLLAKITNKVTKIPCTKCWELI